MPIIDLQRRLTEAGRIRLGDKGPKGAPRKLETFRLTSSDRQLLERVSAVYGGTVTPWAAQPGQFEITTEATALDVIVPPSAMAFSQWYETWSGGGCQKRCDGQWDTLNDAACSCNPEARDCTPHTRLSVLLRDLPSIGVWRLDTQGFYAATELAAAVDLIQAIGSQGRMLPARLRLEQRTSKKVGQGTRRYAVPVLDVVETVPGLLAAAGAGGTPALADPSIGTGREQAALTPVPVDDLPSAPTVPIEQQVQNKPRRPARANAAEPIPSTGIKARKATDTGPAEKTPAEDPAISRARIVARRLRECVCTDWPIGIIDDNRGKFLDAFSLGRYQSAKDIPESEYEAVLEAIAGVKTERLRFTTDKTEPLLLVAATGLVHTPVIDQ